MTEVAEVESYLQHLQQEGSLHSQGRFTLDPGRNRDKMAEFLRQDRVAWAYWMTRLAVQLRSAEARIQLGRNGMIFELTLTHPQASEQVARFLELGEDGAGSSYLRSALLWSQSLQALVPELQPTLLLQRPDHPALGLVLSDTPQLQRDENAGSSHRLTLAFMSTGSQERASLFETFRRDFRARLPGRLAFCPVPISLEGQPLNSGQLEGSEVAHYLRYYLDEPEAGGRHQFAAQAPVRRPATTYWLESATPSPFRRPRFSRPRPLVSTLSLAGKLPPGIDWTSDEGGILDWVDSQGSSHQLGLRPFPVEPLGPAGHWPVRALLQRDVEGLDQWALVQHGVLLDWEPMALGAEEEHYGWRGVVGLDSVHTDLSGLRAVQSPRTQEILEWLKGEVQDIHQCQSLLA